MLAIVFLVALVVRLIYIGQIQRSPFFTTLMGDARGYDAWAQQIAAGDWMGREVFYQAPLYPYFLGTLYTMAGRHLLLVRLVQAAIGSASCVLLGRAGERWFNRRVGIVAGLMLALYAPAIFFDGLLQKTTLDVFCICLLLWLLPQRRWLWIGVTLGALALTRENALALAAVVLLWSLVQPGRVRNAALVVAGLAIVLLPVAARNRYVGGGFYLTTSQFGPNFYMGNNARTDGTASSLRSGRGSPEFERKDATDLAEQATGRTLSPAEVSEFWTNQALTFITSRPGAWLKLMARKAALVWNRTEWLDTESQESYEEYSWLLRAGAIVGNFGVLVPLAAAGVWMTWGDRRRLWVLYVMTLAYAATVVLFYIYARYRFPMVPFLILFASAGIVALAAARRTTLPFAAAVAAVAVFVNWPLLPTDLMRAITENNLGAALFDEKRADEAVAHYERAIAIRADYAPAHNNLGVALAARGRTSDAITAYRTAASLQPDYPDPAYNAGNALLREMKYEEAIPYFRRALDLDQGLPDAHNNLAMALAATGRVDEAVAEFRKAVRLDSQSAQAHRNLADTLAEGGDIPGALDEMRRALELAPGDGSLHYDMGSLWLDAQQFDNAAREFREAIRIEPKSFPAHNNLGIALASQGHFSEAIATLRTALTLATTAQEKEDAQRNLATASAASSSTRKVPPRGNGPTSEPARRGR